MKIFDFTITGWLAVIALLAFIVLIAFIAGNNIELRAALITPVKDITISHLAGLIIFAALWFK